MFDIQSYQKAESVSDAIRLLGEDPEARLIAGGTDVLIKLREFEGFSRLVDIHDLPELKPITREADGTVRVGSGASFTDLEESPIIRECIPMLGESAASVAGPQIRNMGTIGGIFGLIFYALVLIAAISSAISLIEAVSVTFIDHASAKGHERDRNKVLAVVCLAITLLACLVTYKLRNIRFKGLALAASLPPVLFNAVIIGIEIAVMFPDPTSSAPIWLACITNGISVGIGELISCTVLGVVLVKLIESNAALRKVFVTE